MHENTLFGHLPLRSSHVPSETPVTTHDHASAAFDIKWHRSALGEKRSKSASTMIEKSRCPLSSPKLALTWS